MPTLESGLWIFMIVAASAFTFFGFRQLGNVGGFLHMIAMVMWLGLSIFHGAGYEVSATSMNLIYNSTGDLIFNETKSNVVIPGQTDAYWLSYLFLGFAIMNIFFFVRDVWKP